MFSLRQKHGDGNIKDEESEALPKEIQLRRRHYNTEEVHNQTVRNPERKAPHLLKTRKLSHSFPEYNQVNVEMKTTELMMNNNEIKNRGDNLHVSSMLVKEEQWTEACPSAQALPVIGMRFPTHGKNKRVRLNLPNLFLPGLTRPDEESVRNLQLLLRHNGFDVTDRATLAFFVLGKELDVQGAAQCFFEMYKRLNTVEFKSPNRARVNKMEEDGFIEGFARHNDGTFGVMISAGNWNVPNLVATYLCRELMCYIFNMVDYTLLRGGLANVLNCRNFTWRAFAPFEQAKVTFMWRKLCPIEVRYNFLIDLEMYGKVAHSVLHQLVAIRKLNTLSYDEVCLLHPDVVLPYSLTGLNNEHIKYLTADEQLDFQFCFN